MYHKIWLSSRIKTVLSAISFILMSNSALSFVEFGLNPIENSNVEEIDQIMYTT